MRKRGQEEGVSLLVKERRQSVIITGIKVSHKVGLEKANREAHYPIIHSKSYN